MAYPDNSAQFTPSSTISYNNIRNIFFTGSGALSASDLTGKEQWFDASSLGYGVFGKIASYNSGNLNDISLLGWKSVAAKPFFRYTIGSWTVDSSVDVGLPFTPSNGETLYGFSSYGYKSDTFASLSFGSISSPTGFINSGSVYCEVRQIIYRSAFGTLYVRLSDMLNSTVPSSSLLNSMRWYTSSGGSGTMYTMTPISTTSDTAFEKTRIYEFGGDISGIHGTSGNKSILIYNA